MDEAVDEQYEEEKQEEKKEVTPGNVKEIQMVSKGEETKEEKKLEIALKKDEEKGKDAVDLIISKDKKELDLPLADKMFNADVENHFKRIEFVRNETKFQEDDLKKNLNSYKYFSCYKPNPATGDECACEKLSCPDCMKKNQKMYGLRWNYFINDKARLCSFRRNKVYCNGRYKKEDKKDGIVYVYFYVCGHSGQCEPCSRLNQVIDKYLDPKMMEKLRKRDEKMNYIN